MSQNGRASSERRLTALGTGNWNNRGIDNHIKRPAGVSSCGLKRMGMKRMDGIPHPVGCGNTSEGIEASLKYPKECLVANEHVYDAGVVRHSPGASANIDPHDNNHPPAGIEASKTVQYNNYQALSNKERDGAEGGKAPSWLLGQQTKRRVQGHASCKTNGDPIKHDYVMPHKRSTRPIRRMGPNGNDGGAYDNGAAALNWNLQNQQLNTGPLLHHEMTAEDYKAVGARLHISPLGELRYNVGGKEDLRPACTREYTKADKPASRLTQYENDKRQLPLFERLIETDMYEPKAQNTCMMESPDMLAAMYGQNYCKSSTPSAASGVLYSDTPMSARPDARASPSVPSFAGDPASNLKPAPVRPPESPSDRMGARPDSRASPSVQSFAGEPRRRANSNNGRTPMSARGSDRSYRSYRSGDQSIASSYYYSEGGRSQGGGSQGSRRAKSADRLSYGRTPQRRASDYGSEQRSLYSEPSRTVTEQALNEALKGSRSLGKSQSADRRAQRRPNTAR